MLLANRKSLESAQPQHVESSKESGRMYAIAFDLDTEVLKDSYGSASGQNAYADSASRK